MILVEFKKLLTCFKKAVEYNPNYALAHFNLARSIAITGDKIEAAKLYQIAQDVNKITNEISPQDITDKINALLINHSENKKQNGTNYYSGAVLLYFCIINTSQVS